MKIISVEDIRDIYLKSIQRGSKFIFSKLSLSEKSRTKSSFNATNIDGSNWWYIPLVRKRWNHLITGNKDIPYEKYVSEIFSDKKIKMLSIGSGVCSHEIEFARLNPNWEITCIDFSEKLLESAERIANKERLTNIKFLVKDIYKYYLPSNFYDIILFHSSLHHFKHLEKFLERVHDSLNLSGKLIINEYVGVNRLQYNRTQLREINKCLALLDKKHRKMYKSNIYKNRYYGPGILRMIISDPSECVESQKILPLIHSKFRTVEEKGYGGNLLMPVLKDISHNFIELDEKNTKSLEKIFDYEDKYLEHNRSDFVFGIYERVK
jgi:ubiquinone/menaquinone biosynthesis C-methylase UbiE